MCVCVCEGVIWIRDRKEEENKQERNEKRAPQKRGKAKKKAAKWCTEDGGNGRLPEKERGRE